MWEIGRRAAAVGACTVPMFSLPILLGNETGHWRGSNDLQKIPVRIVSGHCPQRLPCQRELARRRRD